MRDALGRHRLSRRGFRRPTLRPRASATPDRRDAEARLPNGGIVGAILRGEEVVVPRGETVIEAGDRVVVFATYEAVKKVERLFAVRLDFF